VPEAPQGARSDPTPPPGDIIGHRPQVLKRLYRNVVWVWGFPHNTPQTRNEFAPERPTLRSCQSSRKSSAAPGSTRPCSGEQLCKRSVSSCRCSTCCTHRRSAAVRLVLRLMLLRPSRRRRRCQSTVMISAAQTFAGELATRSTHCYAPAQSLACTNAHHVLLP
jgi:hypothetical protein